VGGEYEGGDPDDDAEEGWEMEDLELPADLPAPSALPEDAAFVAPSQGVPAAQKWLQQCKLAAEHVAAGSFETAMRMLNRQLGIDNFEPMKPYFLDLSTASKAFLPTMPALDSLEVGLDKSWQQDAPAQPPTSPVLIYNLDMLSERLKGVYKSVTEGKFSEALRLVNVILHIIPLTVVDGRREVDELKELLSIAREYSTALRLELARKEVKDDPNRTAELAAYFTHAKLQPVHQCLSLRSAMFIFFKMKNFATTATFCRRLLELNPPAKMAQQARTVLLACERTPTDEVELNYDPRNPFDTCPITFTPIYRGNQFVECPYSGARFQPECKGKISPVGDIAKIGADASGLLCSRTQTR
jgi:coatomer protein complex subunit alpha (xenin)